MKRISLIVFILSAFSTIQLKAQRKIQEMDPERAEKKEQANAYENREKSLTERMVYGGNLGLGFGTGGTSILIAPWAAYKISDALMAGAGITYLYVSQKYILSNGTSKTLSDNAYGMNFFGRYQAFGPIFLQTEYNPMNFTSYNRQGDSKRVWGNALFFGGGFSQASGGSGFYVLVLYDILWQAYPSDPSSFSKSFYNSPLNFRFGFML